MRQISTKECHIGFGEFIREARLQKDMYQDELAEKVGITQVYLSYLERGERNIDLALALKLCDVLDLDIRKFILTYLQ